MVLAPGTLLERFGALAASPGAAEQPAALIAPGCLPPHVARVLEENCRPRGLGPQLMMLLWALSAHFDGEAAALSGAIQARMVEEGWPDPWMVLRATLPVLRTATRDRWLP